MKLKFTALTLFFIALLSADLIVVKVRAAETISQERYNKVCKWGILNPPECKKKIANIRKNNNKKSTSASSKTVRETNKSNDPDCRWGILNPPKCRGRDSRAGNPIKNNSYKKKEVKAFDEENHNILVYTGTFDINDEIPTATNKDEFLDLVNNDHVMQKAEEIEKNYFYKYDMKASERLEEILCKLT